MAEHPLTKRFLLEARAGLHPIEEVHERLVAHLLEVCPVCKAEERAYREESDMEFALGDADDYDEAYRRARVGASVAASRLPADREHARAGLQGLLEIPPAERLEAVRHEPERFQGPELASLLLAECRDCLPGYPRQAHAFARLAAAVLQSAPLSAYAGQVYALALAHQGNAHRVAGELQTAEALLDASLRVFYLAGDGDPLAAAEIDHLEGSLCRDQRRLREAVRRLKAAEKAYRQQGEEVAAARVLLKLGSAHQEAGHLKAALRATEQARSSLPRDREPRLHLYLLHNLAYLQHALGRDEEARRTVADALPLAARHSDPLTRLRLLWTQGEIARGLGEPDRAEEALRTVREGFFREASPYDAALVTLDLATLLSEAGRTAEVRALAEELVPLFESRGVHREAAAAVLLFADAARAEQLTLAFLQELSVYLRAARSNPQLAFRQPT